MKLFQNILSIVLVTAFFNVVIAKSMHEFFEHGYEHNHEHQSESCLDKNTYSKFEDSVKETTLFKA